MPAARICAQCGAKHYAKGLCSRCYAAKHRQEQPERRQAAARKYREVHRDEVRAQARTWYEQHREEQIAYSAAYRLAHRDEINARRRAKKHEPVQPKTNIMEATSL